MASIISTKTSGGGGIAVTGDTSGVLELQSANGTTAVTIDASQNVGINTASPSQKLEVLGNTVATNYYVGAGNSTFSTANGNNGMIVYGSLGSGFTNSVGFYSNALQRVFIDSNGSLGVGSTNPSAFGKLTVNGAIAQVAAAGSYTIDITANSITVANGGTVDFPDMSGMIIVNSVVQANIAIWLVSGGTTSAVSNVNGVSGTMGYVAGIAGYRWTNNTGASNTVAFFCVRTRQTA
jgi:hypothetical protein